MVSSLVPGERFWRESIDAALLGKVLRNAKQRGEEKKKKETFVAWV